MPLRKRILRNDRTSGVHLHGALRRPEYAHCLARLFEAVTWINSAVLKKHSISPADKKLQEDILITW
jgi:hypothetical protein